MRDKNEYNKWRKKQRIKNKRLIQKDEDNRIGKHYTEEEDDFIIENIYQMSAKDIGYALGRTQISVYTRVQKLREKGIIKFYKTDKLEKYANKLKKA